jgi:hypothetical protein
MFEDLIYPLNPVPIPSRVVLMPVFPRVIVLSGSASGADVPRERTPVIFLSRIAPAPAEIAVMNWRRVKVLFFMIELLMNTFYQ